MSLTAGSKLGPYEIISPLGTGGMGEVYRARDTRLDRSVAIKILPKEMSADPLRKQRFEREAKTISSLNHPHICVLHDIGSQDGIDYLVMECSSFHADKPQLWSPGQFNCSGSSLDFDLHPDGKRFAVLKVGSTGEAPKMDKVSLIFNFLDELRRKVPTGKN